jgi:hypothetical protein
VHTRVDKRPLLVSIIGQINPVHTPYHISLRSILKLSSHYVFLVVSVPRFSYQNPVTLLSNVHYIHYQSHPIRLDHSNYIWQEFKLRSSSLCSFFQPPIVLSLLRPSVLPRTQFSYTFRVCIYKYGAKPSEETSIRRTKKT